VEKYLLSATFSPGNYEKFMGFFVPSEHRDVKSRKKYVK
jgi:hypothetical protein